MPTMVQMIHNTGAAATGTTVLLPDGTAVRADTTGKVTVDVKFAPTLIEGGWQVVVSGGTTHVP